MIPDLLPRKRVHEHTQLSMVEDEIAKHSRKAGGWNPDLVATCRMRANGRGVDALERNGGEDARAAE